MYNGSTNTNTNTNTNMNTKIMLAIMAIVAASLFACADGGGGGGGGGGPQNTNNPVSDETFNPRMPGYEYGADYKALFENLIGMHISDSLTLQALKRSLENTVITLDSNFAGSLNIGEENILGTCWSVDALNELSLKELPNGWGLPEEFGSDVGKFVSGESISRALGGDSRFFGPCGCTTGLCDGYYNFCQRLVVLNSGKWGGLTLSQKEQLVFHELGHCVLEASHLDDETNDGMARSIMHPSKISDCGYKYSKEKVSTSALNDIRNYFTYVNSSDSSGNYFTYTDYAASYNKSNFVLVHPRQPYLEALFKNIKLKNLATDFFSSDGIKTGLVMAKNIPSVTACNFMPVDNVIAAAPSIADMQDSSTGRDISDNNTMAMSILSNFFNQRTFLMEQKMGDKSSNLSDASISIFYINNEADFNSMKENGLGEIINSTHIYILNKSIALSDWSPIGNESNPFNSIFLGSGNNITLGQNKTFNNNEQNIGIWGATGIYAFISNLTVILDGYINVTYNNDNELSVGTIVGQNKGNLMDIIALSPNNGSLKVMANIQSNDIHIGGLVGYNEGEKIESNIPCQLGGEKDVMGCDNNITLSIEYGRIKNVYNEINIEVKPMGSNVNIGLIVGSNTGGNITGCEVGGSQMGIYNNVGNSIGEDC